MCGTAGVRVDTQCGVLLQILAPVCGKDGNDYGNDCLAETAGTTVACKGKCPCEAPPAKCCPKEKPACICGGCGEPLPPGVAVLCAADSPRTCCEEACTDVRTLVACLHTLSCATTLTLARAPAGPQMHCARSGTMRKRAFVGVEAGLRR